MSRSRPSRRLFLAVLIPGFVAGMVSLPPSATAGRSQPLAFNDDTEGLPSCWTLRRLVVANGTDGDRRFGFDKPWMDVGQSGTAGRVVWVAATRVDFHPDTPPEDRLADNRSSLVAVRCNAELAACSDPIRLSARRRRHPGRSRRRTRNVAFDMTRYKEICGRLDYADLDLPAAFASQPLPPELLRVVRYMHDVEQHTTCYMRNLLNTKAHDDPEITEFLTLWNFEEHWHGEALADVLRAHGEPGGAPRVAAMRQRLRNRIGNSPLMWLGMSSLTKHFLAVHMTFGVINEWTTQAGYARLAALAEHDTLSELLRRIKRQEGRHIDYYLTQARRYLGAGSGAQRTARLILRTLWRPVGATVMPESETAHMIRTLFTGDDGRDTAARIDRRIDNLPGLDGMGLIDGAVRRYIAA